MNAKNIQDMHLLAKKHNGKCLSTKYVDGKIKLRWLCEKGHIFEREPFKVKQGRWCTRCPILVKRFYLRKNLGVKLVKRYFIEDMQALAEQNNGKCLSPKFITLDTKLRWQCDKKHIWDTTPTIIQAGHWCPQCGKEKTKTSLLELQAVAKKRNGSCLSKKCQDGEAILHFVCEKGHEFHSKAKKVKEGSWCPECARTRNQLSMDQIQSIAQKRGGKCLSKEYVNNRTRLKWQCKEKHIWFASLFQIKDRITKAGDKVKGTWCAICSKKNTLRMCYRLNIGQMKVLAQERGGKCLSETYTDTVTKLLWECGKGHQWWTKPSTVKYRGSWCPYCAHTKKLSIEQMQKIASERQGKCLSIDYIDVNTKLKWQCKHGHKWEAIPMSIKAGSWCPTCGLIEAAHKRRGQKYKKNELLETIAPISTTS